MRLAVPTICATLSLAGCALNPYQVEDPTTLLGMGPPVADVIKSLRCEVTTFLVQNRLRKQIWDNAIAQIKRQRPSDAVLSRRVEALRQIPYLELAEDQYAALAADFKNVNTMTLALSYDWKRPISNGFITWHAAPSYSDTRTFQLKQEHLIRQDADLGPPVPFSAGAMQPPAAKYTKIYYKPNKLDETFYCYKSLFSSKSATLEDAASDVQNLLLHAPGWEKFANFVRVNVGLGNVTLAKWLQDTVAEMDKNQRTITEEVLRGSDRVDISDLDRSERIINGQLQYQFALSAKPSVDPKYTLVAGFLNPLVPSSTFSVDHTSTFTIFLNTPYAVPSLAAKQGNTKLVDPKKVRWW